MVFRRHCRVVSFISSTKNQMCKYKLGSLEQQGRVVEPETMSYPSGREGRFNGRVCHRYCTASLTKEYPREEWSNISSLASKWCKQRLRCRLDGLRPGQRQALDRPGLHAGGMPAREGDSRCQGGGGGERRLRKCADARVLYPSPGTHNIPID